jgi:hypothetical protein
MEVGMGGVGPIIPETVTTVAAEMVEMAAAIQVPMETEMAVATAMETETEITTEMGGSRQSNTNTSSVSLKKTMLT